MKDTHTRYLYTTINRYVAGLFFFSSPHYLLLCLQSKVKDNEEWEQCMKAAARNLPKRLKVFMTETGQEGLPKKLEIRYVCCPFLPVRSAHRFSPAVIVIVFTLLNVFRRR